jgi:subtilase family serine protease
MKKTTTRIFPYLLGMFGVTFALFGTSLFSAPVAHADSSITPVTSATSDLLPHIVTSVQPLTRKTANAYALAGTASATSTTGTTTDDSTIYLPGCLQGYSEGMVCYTPQQIRQAYDIQPLLDKGDTGKGQTIVIVDDYQDPTVVSDLHTFDQIFGLSDPTLNIIAPDGLKPYDISDGSDTAYNEEISLDVQWAHVTAPDATIDLVLGNPTDDSNRAQLDALISATTYAVQHNLGSVISLSVGIGEACYTPTEIKDWHQAFVEAAAKHITVLAGAGDLGTDVEACDSNGNTTGLTVGVDYPGSDPLVTSVGGTSLNADLSGNYVSESTWQDAYSDSATGGGFSTLFPRPAYQALVKGTEPQARGVPDIAYNADPLTSVLIVMGSVFSGGLAVATIGGTSAATPQWAGIVALADQAAGTHLGFLNPTLYLLGATNNLTHAFHDITTGGNSIQYYDAGTATEVYVQGYSASTGWDPVTGWGSPDVSKLVPLLALTAKK